MLTFLAIYLSQNQQVEGSTQHFNKIFSHNSSKNFVL